MSGRVLACLLGLVLVLSGCEAEKAATKTPKRSPESQPARLLDDDLLERARQAKIRDAVEQRRAALEAQHKLDEAAGVSGHVRPESVPPVKIEIDPALLEAEGLDVPGARDDSMRPLTNVMSVGADRRDILEIDPDKGLSIFFYHLKNLAGIRHRLHYVDGNRPLYYEVGTRVEKANEMAIINALIKILSDMVNLNAGVGETIAYYEQSNMLVIRASQEKIERVRKYLAILDKERPQVRVSVQIAEVGSDNDFQFGIEARAARRNNHNDLNYDSFQATLYPQNYVDFLVTPNNAGWQGTTLTFATKTGASPEPYMYTVRALEELGRANILSRPEIVVAQSEIGTIRSGQDTPINQVSTVGNRTDITVTYKQTGVKLYVTPIAVNLDGCMLNFLAEFSVVTGFTPATVAGAVSNPIVSVRRTETTVYLTYDQMIRIGGLRVDERREEERSIPWINKIPIFGKLFGASRDQSETRELYFFIRPSLYDGPQVGSVQDMISIDDIQ